MTVFLDFDGVLNPFPFDPNPFTNESGWTDFTGRTVDLNRGGGLVTRLHINTSQRAAQALWEASGGAIVWHTTWNQERFANRLLDPIFGWGVLDSLKFVEWNGSHWWKWIVLQEETLPDKFVWIDDDLAVYPDAFQWALDQGGLPIAPISPIGLTTQHVDTIVDYYEN